MAWEQEEWLKTITITFLCVNIELIIIVIIITVLETPTTIGRLQIVILR